MNYPVNFHQTYLYKLRSLTHLLEQMFDGVLRTQADITLSQFMVLMALAQRDHANQRQIAQYLGLSAVAVKRQVDIAKKKGWIIGAAHHARGESLTLSGQGHAAMRQGLDVLEKDVFPVFSTHNQSLNLMQHIDIMLDHVHNVSTKG